jgi:hypothetical protein
MKMFFSTSTQFFADLENRARGACLVFYNQEMPPSAVPDRSRIGIEVNPDTNRATLLVDIGRYYGTSDKIRRWLHEGELVFDSFAELCCWLQGELAEAYGEPPPAPIPQRRPILLPAPGASTVIDVEPSNPAKT